MQVLTEELRTKIIEILHLPGIGPEDIQEDTQLVGGPLGIDSIDILELVMMLEKDYGVTIDNKEVGAKVFATLSSMAEYVKEHCVDKGK